MSKYNIGIVGTGFVGSACSVGFETVLKSKVNILEYDKFKSTDPLNKVVDDSDIIFLCLPTPTNFDTRSVRYFNYRIRGYA